MLFNALPAPFAAVLVALATLLTSNSGHTEPLFDASGLTYRDKVPSLSLSVRPEVTEIYKGLVPGTREISVQCVDLGVSYSQESRYAFSVTGSACSGNDDDELEGGSIQFALYTRQVTETSTQYFDIEYFDYESAALNPELLYVAGTEVHTGIIESLYDGDKAHLAVGAELTLFSNLDAESASTAFSTSGSNARRHRKTSLTLRWNYQYDNGLSIGLRAIGRGRTHYGLDLIYAF